MDNLINYIKRLIIEKYFGKVIISFEAGRIVHFERRQSEDARQFN
jgi:hypothetical protein